MTVLVAGASGATARLLVEQLLHRGMSVRVARPQAILPERVTAASNLTITRAAILYLGDEELAVYGQNPAVLPRTLRLFSLFLPKQLSQALLQRCSRRAWLNCLGVAMSHHVCFPGITNP